MCGSRHLPRLWFRIRHPDFQPKAAKPARGSTAHSKRAAALRAGTKVAFLQSLCSPNGIADEAHQDFADLVGEFIVQAQVGAFFHDI
jgi:hypothetical protein